jgi:hypothetical protein
MKTPQISETRAIGVGKPGNIHGGNADVFPILTADLLNEQRHNMRSGLVPSPKTYPMISVDTPRHSAK